MPWEKGVSITPLPELGKVEYMTRLVEDAKAKGARVVNEGGGASAGTLFYPAVVYPVREGMKLYREEQFGPIVPVMPFEDLETALEYVITSEHGQQVASSATIPDQIGQLVDPLVNQVCRVNINCQCQRGPDVFPFTGRKDSAEGTLVGDGRAALVLDPLDDRGQADRGQQAAARRDRQRAQIQLHQHAVHLLTAASSEIRERPAGLECRCAATVMPRSSPPWGRRAPALR